jgi:hypothetical protein
MRVAASHTLHSLSRAEKKKLGENPAGVKQLRLIAETCQFINNV